MSPVAHSIEQFEAAIRAFPGCGCPFEWGPGARAHAEESLERHGLLLVGEVHGVAENALTLPPYASTAAATLLAAARGRASGNVRGSAAGRRS